MPLTAARLPIGALSRIERRHWIAMLIVALMFSAVAAALLGPGMGLRAPGQGEAGGDAAALSGAPPAPEPLQFRRIAPQDAIAINAALPVSALPNPAAAPFALPAALSEVDRARALDCLTAAVYYEAAVESTDGQRAVAQVVLNRARHPAYPSTVCGVVYQGAERATGCQFTFTCDGSLRRFPNEAGWARARAVAQAALTGYVYAPVGWATHYHANYVVPYWSSSLTKLGNVGTHIFYRWSGSWGTPRAFRSAYPGAEPYIFQVGDLVDALGNPVQTPEEAAAAEALAAEQAAVPAIAPTEPITSFRAAVVRPGQAAPPPTPTGRVAASTPPPAPAPPPAAYRSRLTRQPAAPAQAGAETPAPSPAPAPTQAAAR